MGRLKWTSIVFAFAAVSFAVGTGAFSSVSADRGVEVSVADDEDAMLGIVAADGEKITSDNLPQEQSAVTFHNRFGQTLHLHVSLTDENPTAKPEFVSYRLEGRRVGPGDEVTLYAKINCKDGNPPPSEQWTFAVDATGETVSVETTETITVECTGNGYGNKSSNSTRPSGAAAGQSADG